MNIKEERAAIRACWHDRLMVEMRLLGHTLQADGGTSISKVGQECVLKQLERLVVDVAEVSHGEGFRQGIREYQALYTPKRTQEYSDENTLDSQNDQ